MVSFYQKTTTLCSSRGTRVRGGVLAVMLLASSTSQVVAAEFEGSVGYHSRYMLEGIDVLDNSFKDGSGGLVSLFMGVSQETAIGDIFAEVFLLGGASEDYREAEVNIGYANSFANFSGSVSLSRFFIEADYGDGDETSYFNEYIATLSYDGWERVTPGIEFVYSDANYGELLVLSLESEVEFGGITFTPQVVADFDFGYVTEEHDGFNHLEVGVSWPMPFFGERELSGYVAYSIPGENLRRDEATDHKLLWAGIELPL